MSGENVEIKGLDQLLSTLEKKLGPDNMQRISDQALINAAELFVDELRSQLSSVQDRGYSKGYTVDEITMSDPMWEGDTRVVKVYWSGPHSRKSIIHLNEWGTVRNPNPPMRGKIAASLKAIEKEYHDTIRQALEAGL